MHLPGVCLVEEFSIESEMGQRYQQCQILASAM